MANFLSNTLLVAAVIIGVTAFAAGALIAWLIAAGRSRPEGEPELDPRRYTTLLTLGRDIQTRKLVVGQQGRVMETSALLSDVERRQMEESYKAWQDWLGVTPPVIEPPAADPGMYYGPGGAFTTSIYSPSADVAPKGTMIEQIDDILQDMLPTSAAAGQHVRISEEPGMGVVVWVGARRYEGVDTVEDPVVQQVLHEAVSEWERRQPS